MESYIVPLYHGYNFLLAHEHWQKVTNVLQNDEVMSLSRDQTGIQPLGRRMPNVQNSICILTHKTVFVNFPNAVTL